MHRCASGWEAALHLGSCCGCADWQRHVALPMHSCTRSTVCACTPFALVRAGGGRPRQGRCPHCTDPAAQRGAGAAAGRESAAAAGAIAVLLLLLYGTCCRRSECCCRRATQGRSSQSLGIVLTCTCHPLLSRHRRLRAAVVRWWSVASPASVTPHTPWPTPSSVRPAFCWAACCVYLRQRGQPCLAAATGLCCNLTAWSHRQAAWHAGSPHQPPNLVALRSSFPAVMGGCEPAFPEPMMG